MSPAGYWPQVRAVIEAGAAAGELRARGPGGRLFGIVAALREPGPRLHQAADARAGLPAPVPDHRGPAGTAAVQRAIRPISGRPVHARAGAREPTQRRLRA